MIRFNRNDSLIKRYLLLLTTGGFNFASLFFFFNVSNHFKYQYLTFYLEKLLVLLHTDLGLNLYYYPIYEP